MIPQFKVATSEKAEKAVVEVLRSGYIGQGAKVDEFENALKAELDYDYGVTVNSATTGLSLALHLIGVGPGDEVISTPMTCSATNIAIYHTGADIVWADVDQYGNISPDSVRAKVTDKTKAVMTVDWGGMPCDYDALRRGIHETVPIIEDAAHAYLASYKGISVARSGGDYVVYSFQAIKHLTSGDGGLLVLPEEDYERAVLLRWYGLDRRSSDGMRCLQDITEAGFKYHMNDINAAIGLANMDIARWSVEKARENAAFLNEHLEGVMLPKWPKNRESSYWLYTINASEQRQFEEFMKGCQIAVSKVHRRNDEFHIFRQFVTPLPRLQRFYKKMNCIPVGWWLTQADLEWIVDSLFEWNKRYESKLI